MKFFSTPNTHKVSKRPQDSLMHRISNDPYLDWIIFIVTSTILAGILIGVGIMVYLDTQDRLSASVKSDNKKEVLFETKALDQTLNDFHLRALERATLLKGYSGVADPSL